MYRLYKILQKVREHKINIHDGHDQILSLMGEKEIGGSGADSSNGDLHGVRDSHASGEDESTEAPVNGSLEKITKDGKVIILCATCKTNDNLWYSELSGWCCTDCYE